MIRNLLVLGVFALIFSACVPNKKLVYLQKDDLKKRKDIPRDTVMRTYSLDIQEYKIQPLDILSIQFETLSDETDAFDFLSKLAPQSRSTGGQAGGMTGILVDMEGNIEYAILGKVHLAGLNIFQAQDSIRKVATKYVPDAIVRVRMMNFRFTVLGEVRGEKTVVSTNPRLNMMEAIGLAGGFGELADRSLVKVVRQKGNQTEIFYLNLLEEQYLESPNYFIQQNDVIIVPPLRQRPFRQYFISNLGIIASTLSFALAIIALSK
jgi:polysaccharide biosynthesis/export protein